MHACTRPCIASHLQGMAPQRLPSRQRMAGMHPYAATREQDEETPSTLVTSLALAPCVALTTATWIE
jgi:hypothetical protein